MKKPRTQEEIDGQIKRLEAVQDKVPARTAFGDDNYGAIEAQIAVLSNRLSSDDIYDRWEDDDHIRDNALQMLDWRNGDSDEDQAAEWEELAK